MTGAGRSGRGLFHCLVPVRRPLSTARRTVVVAGLAGLTATLLTSCSSGASVSGPTTTTSPTVDATPAGSPVSAAPTASAEDDGADLVLQGDGLTLQQGDTPQPLPFATATGADVRAALTAALGDLTETAAVPCPQGPRTELAVDGFTALLDGERFVGWTDPGAPDRAQTTADGVGTGTKVADLRSALPDLQVAPGGTTWTSAAAGLSGTLSGTDPGASVTVVSAGQTCRR